MSILSILVTIRFDCHYLKVLVLFNTIFISMASAFYGRTIFPFRLWIFLFRIMVGGINGSWKMYSRLLHTDFFCWIWQLFVHLVHIISAFLWTQWAILLGEEKKNWRKISKDFSSQLNIFPKPNSNKLEALSSVIVDYSRKFASTFKKKLTTIRFEYVKWIANSCMYNNQLQITDIIPFRSISLSTTFSE